MGGQIVDASVSLLLRMEQARRPALAHHVHRHAPVGSSVLISARWYEAWKPAKARQKDRDARWTVKYTKAKVKDGADPKAPRPVDLAIPTFGYKNQIGIDRAHGLIRTWHGSAANAHDGARLSVLVSKNNTAGVWADTAYRSKKNEAFLRKSMFTSNIHQKEPARRPMPERTGRANAKRSAVRPAVEHAFAGQKHSMGCSSALSASLAPVPKSGWPTWPITSSASSGWKPELRPHNPEMARKGLTNKISGKPSRQSG